MSIKKNKNRKQKKKPQHYYVHKIAAGFAFRAKYTLPSSAHALYGGYNDILNTLLEQKHQNQIKLFRYILFTDSFARLLMIQRSNKDVFVLFGSKIGVVFSNHG